ncbi:MAG: RagB/SusD family nutrient uptake outer membrane protein [Bacteroidales bacterium]|nr:RagB/SusD family nutrient uptake outer membrane protein [Bacteroidales bacterium]
MKKIFKNIIFAAVSAVVLSSCVNDLDVIPLNPSELSPETAYGTDETGYLQGLTKIYYSFINTGDLKVEDAGASELVRAFWSTQEVTADACKCAWEDSWVSALNTNTWSSEANAATYAVYCRTMLGISFANEFVRQTTQDKLDDRGVDEALAAKVRSMRAEARFIRAYLYWMALDTFGNVPLTTEDSPMGGGFMPTQYPRAEVFNYCISELKDIAASGDMPAARSNYPRADIGSVYGLMARMYLNAEVYTGTPMWADAKAACESIYTLGYAVCPEYAALFRGDNGEYLAARNEFLFAIPYDAEDTQSYGGTGYLTFSTIAAVDVKDDKGTDDEADDEFFAPTGINNGWAGNRVPDTYVQAYFSPAAVDFEAGTYTITDKRGQLFDIKGCLQSMSNEAELKNFKNGWSCWKYNNYPHDKDNTDPEALETAKKKAYSDIDYPLIRLGEIHLIYAEACMNLGQDALALPKLAELSARAGVAAPTAISKEFLVAERARELMWEGHRRTDLIRYGMYGGDDVAYTWPFKGGLSSYGQTFPSYMNVFSIPPTELASNTALVQNPGYPAGTASAE